MSTTHKFKVRQIWYPNQDFHDIAKTLEVELQGIECADMLVSAKWEPDKIYGAIRVTTIKIRQYE